MPEKLTPWIGVDLDRTMAVYTSGQYHEKGRNHIGRPIKAMCDKVRDMLARGAEVRVFTARLEDGIDNSEFIANMDEFCLREFGKTLPVTNRKDYGMTKLYDDRAVSVIPNTGVELQELNVVLVETLEDIAQVLDRHRADYDGLKATLEKLDNFIKKLEEEENRNES